MLPTPYFETCLKSTKLLFLPTDLPAASEPLVIPTFHINQGIIIMISKKLLAILACPKCKGPVKMNEEQNGLICETCKLLYEIRDDIPIMLIDEAKKLD